ncbi:MAG: hypothetical protein Q8Q26_11230 [Pseudorhodobacter sp.]|nr:hypothetical protein [Pseudorhodobacter sp.]
MFTRLPWSGAGMRALAAGLAGLIMATQAVAQTGTAQDWLAVLSPHYGGDCVLAEPGGVPVPGSAVLAAMGLAVDWAAYCPTHHHPLFALTLPADPDQGGAGISGPMARLMVLANGGKALSLADAGRGVLVTLRAEAGGGIGLDVSDLPDPTVVPGRLFAGKVDAAWLPQASAGGDYASFAHEAGDALIVDVPAGHAWGTTGIASARPLVPVPPPGAPQAQRLRFRLDPDQTTGAFFALVPAVDAGREPWGVHDLAFAYLEPAGGPAELVLWTRREEQGRFAVTDRAVLAELALVVRPDGVVLLTDAQGRILIQGVWPEVVTPGAAWHVYAEASAALAEQAARLVLREIRLDAPAFAAAPDPAAALEQTTSVTLFDGRVIDPRFMHFSAHGGDFARHARLAGGALVVDVPAGQGWGKAGLATQGAVVWLDRFGLGASVRLHFAFDAARSSGFLLGLATHYGLNGNDPGNPRFVLHWRRDADGVVRATRVFDYETARLEVEVPAGMPDAVDLVLTPAGVQVVAAGFPDDVVPWVELVEGQGFRLYAYSAAGADGLPVTMALTQIEMTRTPGRIAATDLPLAGVASLPEAELFAGAPSAAWTPFTLTGAGGFDDLVHYRAGWLRAEVPAVNGWGRVGLLSTEPILRFDSRLQRTPYRLRLRLDRAATSGFSAIFSTAKVEDMWGARAASVALVRLTSGRHAGYYQFSLDTGPYGHWTRLINPAWIAGHWDGALEIGFGEGWMRARLPGGMVLRGGAIPVGVGTDWHMVVQSLGAGPYEAARIALGRITGGWVVPARMTGQERMILLDDADFDPDAYLDLLASELTEVLP